MGKVLTYRTVIKRQGHPDLRIYKCNDCLECKRKTECTKDDNRSVSRDAREHLMHRMRLKLETWEGRLIYAKRKYIVEPVFGDMKYNRNMRTLSLRGKLKATGEFMIMCIAHNLRKIAKHLMGYRALAV